MDTAVVSVFLGRGRRVAGKPEWVSLGPKSAPSAAPVEDDRLELVDDPEGEPAENGSPIPWIIMIVDDDRSVHEATVIAIANERVLGRPLHFLHAYSAEEARSIMAERPDVALLLLDVIMETPDAGLRLVQELRQDPRHSGVRILIRTGQAGASTDAQVAANLPVDGFLMKAQLTRAMLLWAISGCLGGSSGFPPQTPG